MFGSATSPSTTTGSSRAALLLITLLRGLVRPSIRKRLTFPFCVHGQDSCGLQAKYP